MTPDRLKASILQEAITGRLCPQDPNDEPAQELLSRIEERKAELVKQKKLKPDKSPSKIFCRDGRWYERVGSAKPKSIDDELPFELPDGWAWVRLKEIAIINPRNKADDDKDAGFMPMPMLSGGYGSEHTFEIRKWGKIRSGFTHFQNGDIVFAKITPCFQNRKSAIICGLPNSIGAGTTELHVLRLLADTEKKYILMYLKTQLFISEGAAVVTGTAGQQRVSTEFVASRLIPLPPLAEQKRIVEKVERLLPLVGEYAAAYEELEALDAGFGAAMKRSVLQEAITGRLCPQDPNDEPAEKLLSRIEDRKAELVEQKKLKPDKSPSRIYAEDGHWYERVGSAKPKSIDDELPFELPDGWAWCRFSSLVTLISGTSYKKNDITSSGIRILRGGNIQDCKLVIRDDDVFLPIDYRDENNSVRIGDTVLVASTGSKTVIGKPAFIVKEYPNTQIGAFLRIARPLEMEVSAYIHIVFQTEYYRKHIRDCVKGTCINNIKAEYIEKMFVPLPPLAEQKRIVEKVDKLLSIIEDL